MTKMRMKPITNSIGVRNTGLPSQIVTSQQKICTPLGTAISIEEAVNRLAPSCGSPVANIWWTQRPKARKPTAISDSTSAE